MAEIQRGIKKEIEYLYCEKSFFARVADINRGWGQYCSKACAMAMKNKIRAIAKKLMS